MSLQMHKYISDTWEIANLVRGGLEMIVNSRRYKFFNFTNVSPTPTQ